MKSHYINDIKNTRIVEVYELDESVLVYLSKRNIISQYKKAKEFLKGII